MSENRGRFVRFEGRPAVRFVREYAHPVERVWRAVTDPAEVPTWFPSSYVFEPEVGGVIVFSGDPHLAGGEELRGEVLAYDPPRELAFTWGDNEIRMLLEPWGDGGCRFTMTDVLGHENEASRNAAGTDACMTMLDRLLAGRPGDGPNAPGAPDWHPLYDSYRAEGFPDGAALPSA